MTLIMENHFTCDLKKANGERDCEVEFNYDMGGPAPAPGLPPRAPDWPPAVLARVTKIVAVVHPLTQFTSFYCCDEHASLAIDRGQHLPPMPSRITPATDGDLENAKRAMTVVNGMRAVKPS